MNAPMMRPSEWPEHMRPQDPVKQLFDRVLNRRPPRDVSSHGSTVDTHSWIPAVDIKEEAHRFILYVDAPGLALGAIKVSMNQGVLTIEGERKIESQDDRESFLRIERQHGAFRRHFALPASASPRDITITARDGILYIIVRKHSGQAPRQIRIERARTNEPAGTDHPWRAPPRIA
jgi:HSP20 family protein